MKEVTAEVFLKDVDKHQMKTLHDTGLYRHLLFKRPNSGTYWFEIVTWPHRIAITGDMGDFVFTRVEDMFRFFRSEKLEINIGYWAEKITAEQIHGGRKKFSIESFIKNFTRRLREYHDVPEGEELPEELEQEYHDVLHAEDEYEAVTAIRQSKDGYDLSEDLFRQSEEWDYSFQWLLFAIVWGIQQYDKFKQEASK